MFFKMATIQRNECIIGLNIFTFYNQQLASKDRNKYTDNVSSTLLSDFVFEIPNSRYQPTCKLPFG